MSEKQSKNKRTMILVVFLMALLIVGYRIAFVAPPPDQDEEIYDENIAAAERVESLLIEMDRINFDTSVFESPNFRSLENIAAPLTPFATGRSNPFAR